MNATAGGMFWEILTERASAGNLLPTTSEENVDRVTQ